LPAVVVEIRPPELGETLKPITILNAGDLLILQTIWAAPAKRGHRATKTESLDQGRLIGRLAESAALLCQSPDAVRAAVC